MFYFVFVCSVIIIIFFVYGVYIGNGRIIWWMNVIGILILIRFNKELAFELSVSEFFYDG